jgi:hypothetical protein
MRSVTSSEAPRRPWIDRVLLPLRPKAVAGHCPPPRRIADDLWSFERRLRFPGGLLLGCNMTAIRLRDGRLVLIAPLALDDPTREQLAALGPVGAVIAPNSFHHLFAAAYGPAFRDARTYLVPGLRERVPTAPAGTVLTEDARPAWYGELEHVVFGPVHGAAELVFLHRPSSALVVTDLAMNVTTIEPAWQRLAWRASGILPRFGPSRSARLTFLSDRAAARPHLEKILRWEFARIAVAHGEAVERDGRRVFADAFRDVLR